jgi:4,5-dihydroxyphthalate decarboxylase
MNPSLARTEFTTYGATSTLRSSASLPRSCRWRSLTRALMGEDFWAYGFESNRASLATFLRYHHEQGLSKRLLEPEELFAPETMESFKI